MIPSCSPCLLWPVKCRLLITFVNSLDPGQARQPVLGWVMIQTIWHSDGVPEFFFSKSLFWKKNSRWQKQAWKGQSLWFRYTLPVYRVCQESSADNLQTVWAQIGPNIMSGLVWIQSIWHSDGIPKRSFRKIWSWKNSADGKKNI